MQFKSPASKRRALEVLRSLKRRRLKIGCDYFVKLFHNRRLVVVCRFIKTTRKGFNLLNLETSECISHQHFYSRKYVGIDIPPDREWMSVRIPDHFKVLGAVTTVKEA